MHDRPATRRGPAASTGVPAGCTPSHKTLFIPNVTTDVGLSPPYNSLFTFFGQFFDHGVDQTVKSGGTVFVPLKADDPLRDPRPGRQRRHTATRSRASQAFMVLTRAQNQPGPDGILGTADDVQDATNTDSPLGRPEPDLHVARLAPGRSCASTCSNGRDGRRHADDRPGRDRQAARRPGRRPRPGTADDDRRGMATWASVKKQARDAARASTSTTRTCSTSRCSPPTRTATSSPARTGCRSSCRRYVDGKRHRGRLLVEGNLADPGRRSRPTSCTSTRRS